MLSVAYCCSYSSLCVCLLVTIVSHPKMECKLRWAQGPYMRLGLDFGGITQPIVSVGNIRHADDILNYIW